MVEAMWLLPQVLGAVTGIQECRETLRGVGGREEKKTLDRLLHESAVEWYSCIQKESLTPYCANSLWMWFSHWEIEN